MTETVGVVITAEDRASAEIAAAAKRIDEKIKSIKTSGEQAKKSTEFFGTIANALGGSELGGYASQLAQVTEKTSQFAEVQKLGGAGALAFKAGLVAAVGVLAFQVGKAMGDVIFQTQKFTDELEKAKVASDKLSNALIELKEFKFGRDMEEISLIRDPTERAAATEEHLRSIDKAIKEKRESIGRILAEEQKNLDEDEQWGNDALGFNSERKTNVAKQVADEQLMIDSMNKQAESIRRANDETAMRIKAKKEENALKDKSDAYIKNLNEEVELLKASKEERTAIIAIRNTATNEASEEAKSLLLTKQKLEAEEELAKQQEAKAKSSSDYVKSLREQLALMSATPEEKAKVEAEQKAVGGDVDIATDLLNEIEAKKKLAEAEKLASDTRKKELDDALSQAKKEADLKQNELDKLEEERILLNKGTEAAAAFRLMKQGLSKDDAESIAKQQADLAKQKELNKTDKQEKVAKPKDTPELKALESRLLTRGGGDDPAKMTEKNTAEAVKELQQIRKEMLAQQKNNLTLKVVGGKP